MKYQVHATGLTIEEIKSKNKNTLNLGLWCDPQANKKSLVEFDVNQKKKINLIKFTNTYISLLSKELNYYHNTNLSLNFWKHLLYPWVYSFITILYDRYFTIKKIKGKKNYSFIFQKSVKKFIFLKDHLEFRTLSQYDYLNSHIFYDLLKLFNFKTFTYKKINKRKELIDNLKKQNKYKFFFYKLKNLISSKEIVFYDTNLSIKKNFNICKNFFIYNNLSETNIKSNIDLDFRKKILANEGSIYNKDFIYYLDKMILKYLPKSYLEDFKNHYHGKLNRELPKKPKIIVTNISHITDDSFKIWFAKKREENSNIKLIVNQHG